MLIKFSKQADNHLKSHIKSGNKAVLTKIMELISAIKENPFEGIGKIEIISLKGHY